MGPKNELVNKTPENEVVITEHFVKMFLFHQLGTISWNNGKKTWACKHNGTD